MNELQDKQYLALELTKIAYPPITNTMDQCYNDTEIYESYKYYLQNITGLTQDLETVKSLKETVENLQRKLDEKTNENPLESAKIYKVKQIINASKGDMETYIYNAIIKIIGE